MYSSKPAILHLLSLMKWHGISQIVLCPGSRNAPLVQSFSVDEDFTCHSITDERSAGFYALGWALRSARPVAVCCTSGSAVVNLYPAVAEAYYQEVPLIVISADRPEAWIGQMDGQTMPQRGIFAPLIRHSASLPEGNTEEEVWHINRLINESLLTVKAAPSGPVHINIPLGEPLFDFSTTSLPAVRGIRSLTLEEIGEWLAAHLLPTRTMRIMLVLGQTKPQADALLAAIESLPTNVVLIKEHLATGAYTPERWIENADALLSTLSDEEASAFAPDLLITLGGHIVSKRLKQFLRTHKCKAHWDVRSDGSVIDLYQALTHVIRAHDTDAIRTIAKAIAPKSEHISPTPWYEHSARLPEPQAEYSGLSAVGQLLSRMPRASALHLANSSSVRYAQLFRLSEGTTVLCNRGINGIEGSLSAALGYARHARGAHFIVIGDLSFFFDMNALSVEGLSDSLRILLLNNGGGGIFRSVAGLEQPKTQLDPIVGAGQRSAEGWAMTCGFVYKSVHNPAELSEAIEDMCLEERNKPILVEVFTSMEADAQALKNYYQQLKDI